MDRSNKSARPLGDASGGVDSRTVKASVGEIRQGVAGLDATLDSGRRRFLNAATLATVSGFAWGRFAHAQVDPPLPPTTIPYKPFQQTLAIPPILQPLTSRNGAPPFVPGSAHHGIAPEFAEVAKWTKFPIKYYRIEMRPSVHEYIPGVKTPVWTYNGILPGPTFRARIGEPIVVRFVNKLPVETSIHFHGGHTPSHADGFPTFFVDPGQDRDYFYPNIVPLHDGKPDYNESVSTCWYHDHAMDLTGPTVQFGLSGMYPVT